MDVATSKKIKLEKASEEYINDIVDLIYITEPKPHEEWGIGTEKEMKENFKRLMKMEENRFSLDNILVAKIDDKLIGTVLLIEGKDINRLTINSEIQILKKQKGLNKIIYMILSIIGNIFYKECNKDELYISNIAIKPEFRGNGYANLMIKNISKLAKKKGYKKVSLVAKNDKLIKFYKKIGFYVVDLKDKRMATEI